MASLFQTKIDPNFVAQVESKDMQTTWLESEMEKMNFKIGEYKLLTVNEIDDLPQAIDKAADVLEFLRNDILEPALYEKLFNQATAFLSTHVKDIFVKVTQLDAQKTQMITQKDLFLMTTQINHVLPRLYLQSLASGVYLQQLWSSRNKLYNSSAYSKKLEKQGLPSTFGQIRASRKVILDELNELASGIQSPTRHIFYREFMFSQVKPYLDLHKDEDSIATAKDFDQCSRFMMESYTEANRLWCRTAFDVGRTKNEIARRDRKRKYLGEIVQKGFLELSRYCTEDEERIAVVIDILKRIRSCGDPIVGIEIMEQIISNMPADQICRNCDKILTPVCSFPAGVKAFVTIAKKLQDNGMVTEKIYRKLCRHGMQLAKTLVEVQRSAGEEELDKQIGYAPTEQDAISSAWLAVIDQLLLIAAKLWPTDLSKVAAALETIVLVIYPGMDGQIDTIAKYINPNAVLMNQEEQLNAEGQEEEEEEEKEEEILNAFAPKKIKFEDYDPMVLNKRDEDSLVKVLATPLTNLSPWYFEEFLLLSPTLILRKHFTSDYDIQFCTFLANQIVNQPLLKTHEEYIATKDETEKQAKSITDSLLTIVNENSFEFAQTLTCMHNPIYVFEKMGESLICAEARQDIIPALFYGLVRDGYLHEALECIQWWALEMLF
ncbi:Vacuolar_protein sorting 35 [Hexamita inflata]|uniref:Vacuolar protein sorting 35 n=1 Tax=Hexamita inflata TaxID=28002 RepID=A0AA86RIA5_9EUKA|nr:Vacuolar protein sorting 35 [Hexamita inflata]